VEDSVRDFRPNQRVDSDWSGDEEWGELVTWETYWVHFLFADVPEVYAAFLVMMLYVVD
jgi:hypothetical protein